MKKKETIDEKAYKFHAQIYNQAQTKHPAIKQSKRHGSVINFVETHPHIVVREFA